MPENFRVDFFYSHCSASSVRHIVLIAESCRCHERLMTTEWERAYSNPRVTVADSLNLFVFSGYMNERVRSRQNIKLLILLPLFFFSLSIILTMMMTIMLMLAASMQCLCNRLLHSILELYVAYTWRSSSLILSSLSFVSLTSFSSNMTIKNSCW